MVRNVVAAGLEFLAWVLVALLCIGLGTLPARAAPPSLAGAWVTASHDAVVEIYQCGNAFCGAISGIVLAPTDKTPVDWRGRTQCGLVIVQASAFAAGGGDNPAWFGSITDPRNGAVYNARLTLDGSGKLQLRGYIGLPLFGATQSWTRYTGTALPVDCRLNGILPQTAASGAAPSSG